MNTPPPPYWATEFDRVVERIKMLQALRQQRERERREFDVSADSELPCFLRKQAE